MEFYLSDSEQDRLGRDLHSLEVLGPRLADMLEPSTPASGTNAGRPSRCAKSRPPVVLRVMQVRIDVGIVMARWCLRLNRFARVGPPPGNEMWEVAAHLHSHLLTIASMPWAGDLAVQISQAARQVGDLVDPPPPADAPSLPAGGPPPGAAPPTDAQGPGRAPEQAGRRLRLEQGTSRQVAEAARILGADVSRTTVRRWAEAGIIRSQPQDDGTVHYWLADVLAHCRALATADAQAAGE